MKSQIIGVIIYIIVKIFMNTFFNGLEWFTHLYFVFDGLVVTSFIMAWNRYEKILLMREERKKIFLENEKLKKEIYDKETSDSD